MARPTRPLPSGAAFQAATETQASVPDAGREWEHLRQRGPPPSSQAAIRADQPTPRRAAAQTSS